MTSAISRQSDHNVFVSFSSLDGDEAQLVCNRLEAEGLRCWIALRDVKPGENYQASIVQAIKTADIMILLFSSNANLSQEISKELSLASAFKTPVIPLRISDVRPEGAFLYELATRQWIDAFRDWDRALDNLVRTTKRMLEGTETSVLATTPDDAKAASPVANDPKIASQELEAAGVVLTRFLGPIAKHIVRKTAGRTNSIDEFHRALVAKIPSAKAREACLVELRRVLHRANPFATD
jgi:TIR domain